MNEAELCAAFIADATSTNEWTAYSETGGFDILLVCKTHGVQVGIEAKLSLNVKVLTQILPDYRSCSLRDNGPDYRAVLVPGGKVQAGLAQIAWHLGVTVLTYDASRFVEEGYTARSKHWVSDGRLRRIRPALPKARWSSEDWHEWCPVERLTLPGYIPDVEAGHSAPIKLTDWKIKAIKLAIILEDRPVTRADFAELKLSPTRWTDRWTGWLVASPQGYVPSNTMPDFKAQHPVNYKQIKADRNKWWPKRDGRLV